MKTPKEYEDDGNYGAALAAALLKSYVPKKQRDTSGDMVYFIECDGLVKIGVSDDPYTRLKELSTGSSSPLRLLGCIPGGFKREKELHRKFANQRATGEWFYLSNEDIEGVLNGGK